jgi:hypothetical protein
MLRDLTVAVFMQAYWQWRRQQQTHRSNRIQMLARTNVKESRKQAMKEVLYTSLTFVPLSVQKAAAGWLQIEGTISCGHYRSCCYVLNGSIRLCSDCYYNDLVRNKLVEQHAAYIAKLGKFIR